MEYIKPSEDAVRYWRTFRLITFFIVGGISLVGCFIMGTGATWKYVVLTVVVLINLYDLAAFILFPKIEYMQWGYRVEDDRVIIRHGIFWVDKDIIPVIRIQNITVSQGPLMKKYGLYQIEMALASGNFTIEGLKQEVADDISENLKNRLYSRLAAREGEK